MRQDPGSNYNFLEVYAAQSASAGTEVTSAVDHGLYGKGATFFISVGTFATSLVATLQHSASASTDFTAEADTTMGNDVSATFATHGSDQVDCPNPREQYTRLSMVLGGACVLSVVAMVGPKTQIIPADGTV